MCNDKNVVQYSRKVELFIKNGLELDMLTMDDIVGVEDKSQIQGHKSWVKQIKHKNV